MRFVSKLLSTIVFSLLTFLALSPLAAALMKGSKSAAPVVLLLTLGVVGLLVFLAPTGRRAWGRGSLIAGAAFLALPLSMLVLSGQAATEVTAQAGGSGAAAVGATLGAGLMVGASAMIGFIVGTILLIFGLVLVLGGRREVIVVQRS
ncbi:MAG: hypothetical protein KBF78_07350 [Fuscovulum sp.]|nr:hypothetical protein [Fuscovulum sp.]